MCRQEREKRKEKKGGVEMRVVSVRTMSVVSTWGGNSSEVLEKQNSVNLSN